MKDSKAAALRPDQLVTCDLCGGDRHRIVCVRPDGRIVKCEGCGLIFTNPRPSSDRCAAQYQEEYFHQADPRQPGVDYFSFEQCWLAEARNKLRLIAEYAATGRLLDVGCGVGFFLRAAREEGWDVRGVEISEWAAQTAREKYGLDVIQGDFERAELPADSFDVVTCWHMIEHTPSPLSVLRKCRRLLCGEGIIAVEVPNAGCRTARRNFSTWRYTNPAEHLHYFSPRTLRESLRKAGFRPIRILPSGGTGLLGKGHPMVPPRVQRFVGRRYSALRWVKHLIRPLFGPGQFITALARKDLRRPPR